MTFVQRKIDVSITLGTGDFGEGTGNTVTLSGLQVYANITKTGAPTYDAAEVRIYGVSKTLLNKLTVLGKPLAYARENVMTISAGDDVAGMSQVYRGIIQRAYGDFDAMPEVCLLVTAFGDIFQASRPIPPISFPQPTPVSTIVAQIAASMGLSFINDGVDVTISGAGGGGPYYAGSALQQLKKCAEAANFQYTTTGGSAGQSVEIWPNGKARGAMGPLIGPKTGMVGYPKFSDAGAIITALYQPGMALGAAFTLDTEISSAAGTWFVLQLDYELECNNPHGDNPWFMHIQAQRSTLAS